jgi:hypothetical protein|tara:strand:+ start:44 stop:865 length:822 start_codon:yes stop_codon:yes gene_type:complete
MSVENFSGMSTSALKEKELELRENSWNDQHENILRQWGEASGCYRFMNHRAYLMYKSLSMRFTLPVIVLSTLTGTANFAQDQFPESIRGAVPSIIGGLNLIAGLVATISNFLKINELMENHKAAALSYGLLSRNIRLMLALARRERYSDGLDFVNTCKAEYDRLIEQSPSIPTSILNDFEKQYPLNNTFTKPEILDVRAIPKYKRASVPESITKGGPFSKIGELVRSKNEYQEKSKLLEELGSEEEEEEEEEEDAKSEESEEETDVEQGIPKE